MISAAAANAPAEGLRAVLRWAASAAIVLLAHVGVAAAVAHWRDLDDASDPSAAMVIDLAPAPMAPANQPLDMPPGPEQIQADAAPEKPIDKTAEKPEEKLETKQAEEVIPELAPAQNPEIALAAKPPEREPEPPTPQDNQVPAPVTTAPVAPPVEQAPVAAAPTQGQALVSDRNAIPAWTRRVASQLERNKRYPAAARGEKGTVRLAFTLDRRGRVTASCIIASSGSAALDRETLELVRRAQPFPPPPAQMTDAELNLSVPVRFNVH